MFGRVLAMVLVFAIAIVASRLGADNVADDNKKILIDEQLRLADGLIARGHYPAAIEELRAVIKRFSGDPLAADAWARLAETYASADKYEEALKVYDAFFKKFPKSRVFTATRVNYARALTETGVPENLKAAEKVLNEVRDGRQTPPLLRDAAGYYLAATLAKKGETDDAADMYRDVLGAGIGEKDNRYRARSVMALAAFDVKAGRFAEAVKRYQSVIDQKGVPDDLVSEAAQTLAAAYFDAGRFREAAETFGKLSLMFPDTAAGGEARYSRLQCLYRAGDYNQVIREIDSLADKTQYRDLDIDRLNFLRAGALKQQGFHAGALKFFNAVLGVTQRPEYYRQAAIQCIACEIAVGRKKEAAERAIQLLGDAKLTDDDKLKLLAVVAKNMEDPALTIPIWESAVKACRNAPSRIKIQFELAADLEKIGRINDAEAVYRGILDSKAAGDMVPYALMGSASCLFRLNRSERAMEAIDRVIGDYPNSDFYPEAILRKAQFLIQRRREAEAYPLLMTFHERFKNHPQSDLVLFYLGYLDYRKNAWSLAEERLSLALKNNRLSPADAEDAKFYLGWAMLEQGKNDEALKTLRPLVQSPEAVGRRDDEVLCRLGDFFLKCVSLDNAALCFDKVIKGNAADRAVKQRAMIGMGMTQLASGQLKQAIGSFRAAVDMAADPKWTNIALARLGDALVKNGSPDEAVLFFERCLENPVDKRSSALARLGLAKILSGRQDRLDTANRYAMSVFVLSDDPEIVPEAMLLSAELSLSLKDRDTALTTWKELVSRFPVAAKTTRGKELAKRLGEPLPRL